MSPLAEQVFKKPRRADRGGPTLEQINSILEASTIARRPVVAVAAFAGMRIGEIVRLRVEDVDLAGNWLHVVSREGLESKSGHTWKVPIHPILEKLEISAGRADGFTFHGLRSSFKTIAIDSGVPREVVDAWQDHQPDRAVDNQYYILSDEKSQEKMLLVQFGPSIDRVTLSYLKGEPRCRNSINRSIQIANAIAKETTSVGWSRGAIKISYDVSTRDKTGTNF